MKYASPSFKYMLKNFHKLLFFALVPAIVVALFYNVGAFFEELILIGKTNTVVFMKLYSSISFVVNKHWWIMLIAIAVLIISACGLFGATDRHMRIGKFDFKVYKYLNESFSIIAVVFLISILASEALSFVTSAIIVFFSLFIPASIMVYIGVLLGLIMLIIWAVVMSLFLLTIPYSMVQGYRIGDAMSASVRSVAKRFWKVFSAFAIVFIVAVGMSAGATFLFDKYSFIVNIVLYTLIYMYFIVLSMTVYFDVNEYERKDLKRGYFR